MVCAFLSTVTPLEMRALTVIIVTVIIVAKSRRSRVAEIGCPFECVLSVEEARFYN